MAIFEFNEIISSFRVLITRHRKEKGIMTEFFLENISPKMGKIFHQKYH